MTNKKSKQVTNNDKTSAPISRKLLLILLFSPEGAAASSVLQYSIISWGGLRGNVTFSWGGPGTNVTVEASLEVVGVEVTPTTQEYDWAIHDWPVRYDTDKRCGSSDLGSK